LRAESFRKAERAKLESMQDMHSNKQEFSCHIIGAGTLPIQCAEILLTHGHEVRGIISADSSVIRWSVENRIPHIKPTDDIIAFLSRQPFDYLFSVVNEFILPSEVFELPRKSSINYHDAPLPRYAGTHATSWAIMNMEKRHGVTWHLVSDVVDAGDILKQREVEIAEGDTAFSLNTKCYEAAIFSFTELIEDLSRGQAVAKRQDLSERTFFARFKRPAAAGVIRWNSAAEEIDALVRALDFGPHPNPLGSARLVIEKEFIIVSGSTVADSGSVAAPGTVTKIDANSIRVSTATREVEIRQLLTIDGKPLPLSDFISKYNLCEGYRLTSISSEDASQIESFNTSSRKHESFWVKTLASLEPVTLPFAASNAQDLRTRRYASLQMQVPDAVMSFLQDHTEIPSRSDFLLAAFGTYIARLAGIDYFDIGYADFVRESELPAFEGLFARQRPLRFSVDCSKTFIENSIALQEQIKSIEKRQTYTRDVFIRYPALRSGRASESARLLPLAFERVERLSDEVMAQGDIALIAPDQGSQCLWTYNTEVFDESSVAKLAEQFRTFLSAIVSDPDKPVADLSVLTEEERNKLLVEWNSTAIDYPNDQCMHQLFEAQMSRTPDAEAIVFEDQRLTYRELNQKANQLAHYLRKLGVGPETFVGVCAERSIEMVVGLLAILKAGGAYVPLDPAYPKERLAFMLEDTQAPVLLTQQRLIERMPEHTGRVVCLDADWSTIAQEFDENPISAVRPNNMAYVIYTSGSTGKPKGVAIEHHSPVALIYWARDVFAQEHAADVLASTSICFDLSVYELFVTLSWGGKIILAENALHLPRLAAANEVTLVNTVPSAITELLRMGGVPSSVRVVNLAGEPLKTALVQQIYQLGHIEAVYDLYGPSETTTYSTFTLRTSDGPATIGRPIANTQVYLLDQHMNPVPEGVPGELYIGGAGVARGYLHRPELTAEKFLHNPFSMDPDARFYRTGDLARYLPDGNLEFLGRIDHQVKIRGFRIELGEVEAAITKHPTVDKCVVVAREDTPGDRRLVAYVVAKSRQTFKSNDLRSYLNERLPDFMAPSVFVQMDDLPLTPNGKIDRRALPIPEAKSVEIGEGFVVHRDTLELQLRRIWEELLGIHPIGVRDNFFEIGGHSLLAVRMFTQVEKAFGKNLPLATLFQAPTIEKLAEIIRDEGYSASWSSLVPIQSEGSRPPLFCIHAGGGNVLTYRDLARRLGNDQPLYGLQAQGLGGRGSYHSSVEEMAAYYIEEIRVVQPEGPYNLAGACFGGVVAFEMAQQLRARGEKVGLVAMFDSSGPGYPKLRPSTELLHLNPIYDLVRRVEHHWGSLTMLEPEDRRAYLSDKIWKAKKTLKRYYWRKKKKIAGRFYQTMGQALPPALKQTQNAIIEAQETYVPQVYPGRVTLFCANKQPLGIYRDLAMGWTGLAAEGLEIHVTPGTHGAIVAEPRVRVLAEQLKTCLHRVQETESNEKALAYY